MAQIAKNEAEKVTDNVAELGKRTADKGVDAARRRSTGPRTPPAAASRRPRGPPARRSRSSAQWPAGRPRARPRSARRSRAREGAGSEQRRDLPGPDPDPRLGQVAQIQGELLRASMERAAAFTRRYFEVVQTVVASTTSTAKEQARKTA